MLDSVHSIILKVDDKLSYNLERIESTYSLVKNLKYFSRIWISFIFLILFFLKAFLYRITSYIDKDIYESYIDDKEYNLIITIITLLSINICSVKYFQYQNTKTITSKMENLGFWLFKLFIDIVNTYKFFYFFVKFEALHNEIYRAAENNFKEEKIGTMLMLTSYFLTDFLLANTTSSFSRCLIYIFCSDERRKIRFELKRKAFIFSIRFCLFYLLFYKKFTENFQVFETRTFDKSNELMFFTSNFLLCRAE